MEINMQSAIVVSWKQAFPGRETRAIEYGLKVRKYWEELATKGISSKPEFFFSNNGHNLWIVKGDSDALLDVWMGKESLDLLTEGQLLLEGFGWHFMLTGQAGDDFMARYAAMGADISLH